MISTYTSLSVNVNGKEYTIVRAPTGFGLQKKRNGRFTLRDTETGDYWDFQYGDSYAGYTSPNEAWKDVKNHLKKIANIK